MKKNIKNFIYLSLVKDMGEKDFIIGNTEQDVQFFTSSCCQKKKSHAENDFNTAREKTKVFSN
jgi:hypothetical protein